MTEQAKSPFEELLDDVQGLAKSMSAEECGDEKIEAAAEDGAGDEDEDEDEDEGKPLGKSFNIVLEDGTELPAVDGTELVKSLTARIEKNEGVVLEALQGALGVIKQQGELIKSLQGEFSDFRAKGKGRKAVVNVHEKPAPTAETLAKSEASEGVTGEQFMAKAMDAMASGRISSREVSVAEAHINMHQAPPADIVRRVLSADQ